MKNSGSIFIDNQNIENYTLSSLRKQIAVVHKMFSFLTPFFNITLNNDD
jgi:ABC-type multidrug transport system fused ATPase/permease subunit